MRGPPAPHPNPPCNPDRRRLIFFLFQRYQALKGFASSLVRDPVYLWQELGKTTAFPASFTRRGLGVTVRFRRQFCTPGGQGGLAMGKELGPGQVNPNLGILSHIFH